MPSVLSTAQGLKTSATVYPNEDRPRLVNQSDCRISGFVTEHPDKKQTVISSTHEENGFHVSFHNAKIYLHETIPASIKFVTGRAMFENSVSITPR